MARKKKTAAPVVNDSAQNPEEKSQIGMVSEPTAGSVAANGKASRTKLAGVLSEFTIYDAMLLTSLVCIVLATLRVFFAMHQYGGYFWDKPWNP